MVLGPSLDPLLSNPACDKSKQCDRERGFVLFWSRVIGREEPHNPRAPTPRLSAWPLISTPHLTGRQPSPTDPQPQTLTPLRPARPLPDPHLATGSAKKLFQPSFTRSFAAGHRSLWACVLSKTPLN